MHIFSKLLGLDLQVILHILAKTKKLESQNLLFLRQSCFPVLQFTVNKRARSFAVLMSKAKDNCESVGNHWNLASQLAIAGPNQSVGNG